MEIGSNEVMYQFAPGLWIITSYYNPCNYASRRENYLTFAGTLEASGLPLLTVECAFEDQPFTLPPGASTIQLRSQSVVWQKERLLNLATSWLPRSCRYVAWLDCDLVFCDSAWARKTTALLDVMPLAQVFDTCIRLPRGNRRDALRENRCRSFGAITPSAPEVLKLGRFADHGHTGYGWAARRELLDHTGLYEYAIAGSADDYMAHAAFGDLDARCIRRMMNDDARMIDHFKEWARPFAAAVAGRVGVVPGEVLHLWHGELKDRNYDLRHQQVTRFGFNPYTDLIARPGCPLEWAPTCEKLELKAMFRQYFAGRNEDGLAATA